MRKIHSHIISRVTAIATGLIFLNMSFFLTEVRMLDLDTANSPMVENIVKMLTGVGFEEEKDAMGESSEGTGFEQIVDLHITIHPISTSNSFLFLQSLLRSNATQFISASPADIATPPPRVA